MKYSMQFTRGEVPLAALQLSIMKILNEVRLLSLATLGGTHGVHTNAAFFASDDALNLYFVSERGTQHGQNLEANSRAAATVSAEPPEYGEGLRGLQLAGRAEEVRDAALAAAFEVYQDRFPTFATEQALAEKFRSGVATSALYRFRVEELTVLDEPRFGRRNYTSVAVTRQ